MKKKKLLLLILVLGFVLRIFYLFYFKDTPFFNPALMDKHDQKTFHLWAEQIQQHPLYVDGKIFYMSPLYPYFLSFLYGISGKNFFVVSFFQLMLDIVMCLCLYLLGKYIFDKRVGLLAAFLGCFYRTFIVYAGTVLSDSLILFLYIAFITSLYFTLKKPNIWRWVLSGFILGLAALAKPTIGIYLPFLLAGLFFYPVTDFLPFKFRKKINVLFCFGILLGVAGLTILPVTIRNYILGRSFVPICSNRLINWQIGNSADSLGLFCYPRGPLLSPFSIAFWKLQLQKTIFFFNSYEWPQNLSVHLIEKIIPVLKLAFVRFGLVVPVGMAGLVLLCKNWRKNFLFISFTFTNILWVILFFITDRYRLPAVGCLIISASYTFVWTLDRLKEKRITKPLVTWFSIGIFAYFFNVLPGPLVPGMYYKIFSLLSKKNISFALEQRNLSAAFKKAELFVKTVPGNPDAYFFLAYVYAEKGNTSEAIFNLEKSLKLNPEYEPAKQLLIKLKQ